MANYIREPYSADLDFGTGEWSASAWMKPVAAAGANYLTYSNTMTGRTSNCNVIENFAVAPDGTQTAALVRRISGSTLGRFQDMFGYGSHRDRTLAISFYVKPADVDPASYLGFSWMLNVIGSSKIYLNTFTPTKLEGNGTVTVEPVTNGWYRVKFVGLKSNEYRYFQIGIDGYIDGGVGVNEGTVESGVYVWGYQVELDQVTNYKPTTTTAFIPLVAPAIHRGHSTGPSIALGINTDGKIVSSVFDGVTTRTVVADATYSYNSWIKAEVNYKLGKLALFVNGQEVKSSIGDPLLALYNRYNNQLNSDTWAFSVNGVATSTVSQTLPSGISGNVISVLETTGNGIHRLFWGATTYDGCASIHVKPNGRNYITISGSTGGGSATFELIGSGTVTQQSGVTSPAIQALSNGWYRVSMYDTGINQIVLSLGNSGSFVGDSYGSNSYEGDAALGVYLWGAQLETGSVVKTYQRVGSSTSDFDFAPVLTIGNSYATNAPFPGSLALVKLSATVPTAEQSLWMYEQEKQMFREGAQVTLPDSNSIADLTYDEVTDKWIAVSSTNMSEWSGLVRTNVTAVPLGSYSKLASAGGVTLQARGSNVDITIPSYGLRKELVKRAESAARLARNLVPFDYVGGFTANTTNGSTSISNVAGLSYPTSYIGAQITGTGIQSGTVITAVNGTTIYISKPATATGTAVQISFTDFILPVGYEAKAVMSSGALKQEGATKDYTRLFDGFKETLRFGAAPGYTAWVQVQAVRSAA